MLSRRDKLTRFYKYVHCYQCFRYKNTYRKMLNGKISGKRINGLKTEYDVFLINSLLRFTHQTTKLPSRAIKLGCEIQKRNSLNLVNLSICSFESFLTSLSFLFSLNDLQTHLIISNAFSYFKCLFGFNKKNI